MRIQSPREPSIPDMMQAKAFKQARILIVDDEPANVELLKRLLERSGFVHLHSTSDPRQAAPMFKALAPDLVLLDLHMPHLDGLDVLDQLSATDGDAYVPILIVTGDLTADARPAALSRGAKDFIQKPFQAD